MLILYQLNKTNKGTIMSEQPKIIDTVPGVTPSDADVSSSVNAGDRVPINFKGDPSTVPGHPSNPNTDMVKAMSEYALKGHEDQKPTDTVPSEADGPSIDELKMPPNSVPKSEMWKP